MPWRVGARSYDGLNTALEGEQFYDLHMMSSCAKGVGTTIRSVNAFPTGGFDRPLPPNLGAWSRFAMG